MSGVAGRLVRAALEANGVAATTNPAPTATATASTGPVKPTKPRRKRDTPADIVVLLGAPGVLVRSKDGRLPRDGEVEPDGACLRIRVGRAHVLVAGVVRRFVATCRWATVSELDPRDLEIVRAVAPSQLADLEACVRVSVLAQTVAELAGVTSPTGDSEIDLRLATIALKLRDDPNYANATRLALDFAVAEHMMQA